jgi:hypothetical protein
MDDEIDTLYRMFFNLAIKGVAQKAIENGYTKEEFMSELEKEMHIVADSIPKSEAERFVNIIREESIGFNQQLVDKEGYKDVNKIMEEIGWQ